MIKAIIKKIIPESLRKEVYNLKPRLKRWALRAKIKDTGRFDSEVYWIDPRQIKYATKQGLHIITFKNKTLGGNWDKGYLEFEELDVFRSFKKRIEQNTAWENTALYARILNDLKSGREKWGCKTEIDLKKRCLDLDALIDSMREGYKAQGGDDEITLNIDRDGILLLNHGRHRLSCAKLLGINKIPVKITARHKKWVDFKTDIIAYNQKNNGRVYAPLVHLDLCQIPSLHKGRFEIIRNHLSATGGRLLDVGAHWGYFSHKFEELGFECSAVEQNPECFYFLKKLKISMQRKFQTVNESIFSFVERLNEFDVVLGLSIFHWFIRDEKTLEQFKTMLGSLKMKEMFFQSHSTDHSQMQNVYKNFSEEEFLKFIIDNSCLNTCNLIGEEQGRKIFKLSV